MKHDGKFYSFICSLKADQWEQNPTTFYKSRVFEFTDAYIVALAKQSGNVTDFVMEFPAIFAYEDEVGKNARLGYILSVKIEGNQFVIDYKFDEDYLPLSMDDLTEFSFELGLEANELSRTHWALKHKDVKAVLANRGKAVKKINVDSLGGDDVISDVSLTPKIESESEQLSQPAKRHKVFISYSHADTEFLERLMKHLKPLSQMVDLEVWADAKIVAGENWKQEIDRNLSECSIAILILSADFLASDFITAHEIPPLLQRVETNGCRIVPLIAKPCLFTELPLLSRFQSINDPKDALLSVSAAQQEEIYVKTARQVLDFAK